MMTGHDPLMGCNPREGCFCDGPPPPPAPPAVATAPEGPRLYTLVLTAGGVLRLLDVLGLASTLRRAPHIERELAASLRALLEVN